MIASLDRVGGRPPVRRKGRGGATSAIAVSIALHGLLLDAFLIQRTSPMMAGGRLDRGNLQGGAGVLSISLISSAGLTRPAGTEPRQLEDPLVRLLSGVAKDNSIPATEPRNLQPKASLDALFAAADRALSEKSLDKTATSAKAGVTTVNGELKGAGTDPSGDLLEQVKPCWRRALASSQTPVTLKLALDAQGRLTSSPTVESIGKGDRNSQRIAVERALQGVMACLPYHPFVGKDAHGVYRLAFGISDG